ncbi:MAG: Ig-like domain-containing protein [bacterium]|nr:Ig-like domain-containing protein [bacterium]
MRTKFFLFLLIFLFGLSASGNYATYVVISQLEYDASGLESAGEFVELYNPTNQDINISGWDIIYKTASGTTWSPVATLPSGSTIPACGYFLVGGDDIAADWPGVVADYIDTSLGFSGTGGHVGVRDENDVILDYVGYETALYPEGGIAAPEANATSQTIERISGPAGTNVNGQGNGWDTDVNGNDWVVVSEAPSTRNSPTECPPDIIPPQVSSTDPADLETGVDLNKTLTITFNEEMDTGTVEIAFSISPLVAGATSFIWSSGNKVLSWSHTTNFSADNTYTVTISTAALDTSGNALDGDGNGSEGPAYSFSFVTRDATAPNAINDLAASDGPGVNEVSLSWTAVGDDGGTGTATSYIVKYSTQNITNDTDFNNATTYVQSWTPLASGNNESYILTMPSAGTLYYFSIKAVDDSANESPFGNVDSATSGDASATVSPNIRAAAQGRVTYTFTYNVISPKFDGDDSFRLVVPSTWGTVSAGIVSMTLDGSNYTGFTISGQEITASNITANSTIRVVLGPITVQNTAQNNVEFEMYTNINSGGFAKVDGSPTITVAEPAVMTIDPSTDPHHTPGTTDIVTVEIRDSGNNILYGAQIDLVISKNPGGDATVNNNTVYTDVSGSATFQFKLSNTPGVNEVTVACNSLVGYYLDTAFAGNYISQNYPNPFNLNKNRVTKFKINLETSQEVLFNVYNVNGELVKTLYEGSMDQGLHEIQWDGTNDHNKQLDSGVYFVFFKYGSNTEKFMMTIVK